MTNIGQSNVYESEQVPFGAIRQNFVNVPLTVSEINHLWTIYQAESMACCFQKHMLKITDDPGYQNIMQSALELSSRNISLLENVFNSIQHPIPIAFGEKDVNQTDTELFDETFIVLYTRITTKFILQNYVLAFEESIRPDIRQLFSDFIDRSKGIIQKADDILSAKGVFPKIPYIVIPDKAEFVNDKDYYGSFFGNERSLNALEISNILSILEFKVLVRALKLGFAQVVKSDEIRKFFKRGARLAEKHINVLRSILEKDGIPGPEIIDYRVTDSKESPYSDRLMLLHTTAVIAYILSAYGTGLSRMMRKDIVATYTKFIADILVIAKDGADLLIKNGWLEKIPETVNRYELTH